MDGSWTGPPTAAQVEVQRSALQLFTHFTDQEGARGITGQGPLSVGERVRVPRVWFEPRLAGDEDRTFVTTLGPDARPRQLARIGVRGEKQRYAIQFSEFDALWSGVAVTRKRRRIYWLAGQSLITGTCTVMRVR